MFKVSSCLPVSIRVQSSSSSHPPEKSLLLTRKMTHLVPEIAITPTATCSDCNPVSGCRLHSRLRVPLSIKTSDLVFETSEDSDTCLSDERDRPLSAILEPIIDLLSRRRRVKSGYTLSLLAFSHHPDQSSKSLITPLTFDDGATADCSPSSAVFAISTTSDALPECAANHAADCDECCAACEDCCHNRKKPSDQFRIIQ